MPGGVETERHFRPRTEGAVEVVAVAAANVQQVFAGKFHPGGEQAREFEVAAPFAVDVDAVEVKRPFAPGL